MSSNEKLYDCPYKNGLHELVVYYAGLEDIKKKILKFQSVRSIIEGYYQVLLNKKELVPIEEIDKSEKEKFWSTTKGLERNERIIASKAIYLIELIRMD